MVSKLKIAFIRFMVRRRNSRSSHLYRLQDVTWVQRELTLGEDGAVKSLLKPLDGIFTEKSIGKFIDRLLDGGVIPALLGIILKRYEPNFLFRLANGKNSPGEMTPEVCSRLKNSEVAKVLTDFFILNTRWMPDLQILSNLLDSDQLKNLPTMLSNKSSI
jgi:hypothetical protein